MRTLTIDFETYYTTEYSLKRLTTEEYVRDNRFQVLCMSVKARGEAPFTLAGPEAVEAWVRAQDWAQIATINHHAHFDGFILSEYYGVFPAFIFDTLSMARAVNGPLAAASLEMLSARYGLGGKTVPYNLFKGYRWENMPLDIRSQVCSGCEQDVALTEHLFFILASNFPCSELEVVDTTIRMYTEPQMLGDEQLFAVIAAEEEARKRELLARVGVTTTQLQSSEIFLKLLVSLGEDVPYKPGKNGPIPCFAATDWYMQETAARDDVVGELVRARLDVRSTITECRAGLLAAVSGRGALPVYLKYFAAVTGRWGGGERANIQNLPAERSTDHPGRFRSGLMAPEGYSFVTRDFSQIEYRILCSLAGQNDKLEALAAGRSLYCEFGSTLFKHPVTKAQQDEYTFSKKIVLGSGYGTGKDKAEHTARAEGFPFPRKTTDAAIDLYRQTHPGVPKLWRRLDRVLPILANGGSCSLEGTPLRFEDGSLILPNGQKCHFTLEYSSETESWYRKVHRGSKEITGTDRKSLLSRGYTSYWGGGLTEFVCQALARIRLSEMIIEARRRRLPRPVFLVHDEYVCLAKDAEAKEVEAELSEIARAPSLWWPHGPPFSDDGVISKRYGK